MLCVGDHWQRWGLRWGAQLQACCDQDGLQGQLLLLPGTVIFSVALQNVQNPLFWTCLQSASAKCLQKPANFQDLFWTPTKKKKKATLKFSQSEITSFYRWMGSGASSRMSPSCCEQRESILTTIDSSFSRFVSYTFVLHAGTGTKGNFLFTSVMRFRIPCNADPDPGSA